VLDVTAVTNKQQWFASVRRARAMLEELRASITSWIVVSAIEGRLGAMEAAVANGRIPSLHDRERGIVLGLIAVRSFVGFTPEFSQLLLELAQAFQSWRDLPDQPSGGLIPPEVVSSDAR
jgi:hypothetical protein